MAIGMLLAGAASADPVTDGLRRALGLAQSGRAQEAWQVVAPLKDLNAGDLPALTSLAAVLRRESEHSEALAVYGRCLSTSPREESIRRELESLIEERGLPLWLAQDGLEALPLRCEPVFPTQARPGSSLGARWIAPAPYLREPEYEEPRSGRRLRRSRALYEARGDRWLRRFVVHFDEAAEDALAKQVGALLCRLSELLDREMGLGRPLSGPGDLHVWLCAWGPPAAESWNHHLYVYALGQPRSPLEWVRELAHELGHALLPGPGGYRSPESWANGPLGERLLLRWLSRPEDVRAGAAWDPPPDLTRYLSQRVDPLLRRFRETPPTEGDLSSGAPEAMEAFLALCLGVEQTYGARTLALALRGMKGTTPSHFWQALTAALTASTVVSPSEGRFPLLVARRERVRVLPSEQDPVGERGSSAPLRATPASQPGSTLEVAPGEWWSAQPGWHWVELPEALRGGALRVERQAVSETPGDAGRRAGARRRRGGSLRARSVPDVVQ